MSPVVFASCAPSEMCQGRLREILVDSLSLGEPAIFDRIECSALSHPLVLEDQEIQSYLKTPPYVSRWWSGKTV